jgi:asparagine synthase (glutamine-hydrolysing)
MCGICGWLDWDGAADGTAVRRMTERLRHRGPDGSGLWRDPSGLVALGHRRLAVLDTTDAAEQPMVDPGGSVLAYNGEVYSFRELRRQLEADGRRFRSTGDTEVVLASLVKWGPAALDRFNGMFALALWEPDARRLLLVRDRLGIKPLFVAMLPRGLAFASEVPALLAHPAVGRSIDRDAVVRWLQQGYPTGGNTLLRGVVRLPPGHLMEAGEGRVRVRRWYDLLGNIAPRPDITEGEAVDELHSLLGEAVERRLVSDVPLGCFLSGGVDSAAVVAAAARTGAAPEALTIRFAGGEDESPAAAATAAALSVEHRVESCSPVEMLEVFAGWYRIAGDPLADPSLAPTWVVSRAARRRWIVALSGDGGDELLGGYPRLRLMPWLDAAMAAPKGVRSRLLPVLPAARWASKLRAAASTRSRWQAYQALQGIWPSAAAARLCRVGEAPEVWSPDVLRRLEQFPRWLRYRLLDALTFLPERVLAKVDRASMDHGLEVRVPLLDHRVVEFLFSLPPPLTNGKRVLRKTVARFGAPDPPRRKRGFEVPLAAWLRGPLRETVARCLDSPRVDELGLDRKVLSSTWEAHLQKDADHAERLLAVAILVRWTEEWT